MKKITTILSLLIIYSCSEQKQNNSSISTTSNETIQVEEVAPSLFSETDKNFVAELNYEEIDGLTYFYGKINLPQNTKVGITVSDTKGYNAQNFKIFVNDYQYRSEGFSSKGSPLIGNYKVTLFTNFNIAWQKDVDLELLNSYTDEQIVSKKDEIFGNYKKFEITEEFTFGSNDETISKSRDCEKTFIQYKDLESDIKSRIKTIEDMYKSLSKDEFYNEIGMWNRKNSQWRKLAEKQIENDCCNNAKLHMSIAITNQDLIGTSFATVYELGIDDANDYKNEAVNSLKKAMEYIKSCKEK